MKSGPLMYNTIHPGDIVCCSHCGKEIARVIKKIFIGSPCTPEDIEFFPEINYKLGHPSVCPDCDSFWYHATRLFIKGRGWLP